MPHVMKFHGKKVLANESGKKFYYRALSPKARKGKKNSRRQAKASRRANRSK